MAERTARRGTADNAAAAGDTLVVVESPKKAKTLQGILGRGYKVEASFGHVRDLPPDRLGVDPSRDFAPEYVPVPKAAARLAGLRKQAAASAQVVLATDPDREGEAIAWHLATALNLREGRYSRVTFHEITRAAVQQAFQQPRSLDMPLVNAQQARRVLDRLVGYRLSPLLWRKVQKGASAGRVQSVALRLIVEREREIRAFVPKEYWTIDARLTAASAQGDAEAFTARLMTVDGAKAEIGDEATARTTVANLEAAQFTVEGGGQKSREQGPPPPFTTSTLQQTAANRLHFAAKRTMQAAQSLFEGSYITYHRTDSVQVSAEAVAAARKVIAQQFPPEYLPEKPRHYRTRSKNAQEAHEAIRPVDPARTPDALRNELSGDEAKLYDLIWRRFLASQMASARYLTDELRITGRHPDHLYGLRAIATVLVFPGYLTLYGVEAGPTARRPAPARRGAAALDTGSNAAPEGARPLDDAAGDDGDDLPDNERLPKLDGGAALRLLRVLPAQHFTEPPPRYSEGALIRALEAAGVGRPSTYAAIVGTIQERNYVVKERQVFVPTPLGEAANDFLVEHFPDVVSLPFTASMEEDLDRVAAGELTWTALLHRFYGPFDDAIEAARTANPATLPPPATAAEGTVKPAAHRASSGTRRSASKAAPAAAPAEDAAPSRRRTRKAAGGPPPAGEPGDPAAQSSCPECGAALVQRTSSYGAFMGCSAYPKCRYIQRDGAQTDGPARPRRGAGRRSAAGSSTASGRGAARSSRARPKAEEGAAAPPASGRGQSKRAAAAGHAASTTSAGKPPAAAAGAPTCPRCGGGMVQRQQRATGQSFWGCATYPECRGTRPAEEAGS